MSTHVRRWLLLSALAATGGVDACKIEECLRHTDCPRTQSCELGACVSPPTPSDGSPDAGESSGARAGSNNGARGGSANPRGGSSSSSAGDEASISAGETSGGDSGN